MGKTNFTKVEASLGEGLRKMEVQRLLNEADKASGKPPKTPEQAPKLTKEQRKLITDLELNLARLRSKDRKIYTKLKVRHSTIQRLITEAPSLKEEDWNHLSLLLKKTETFIKMLFPDKADDKHIESEQEKHINKRFNVNEKWLPLK